MRALLLALVALFHVSAVSWAGETILSGDSDHTYLPTNHEQEVLLHRFSYDASNAAGTYLTWGASYNANCHQQYGYQPSVEMASSNRACTLPENAFRAPSMFRLTRVMIRTGAAGTFAAAAWAQSNIRVVTVSTDGTLTEVGAETAFTSGVGNLITWNLATDVSVGTGVALQARFAAEAGSSVVFEDIAAYPVIELWGIWK